MLFISIGELEAKPKNIPKKWKNSSLTGISRTKKLKNLILKPKQAITVLEKGDKWHEKISQNMKFIVFFQKQLLEQRKMKEYESNKNQAHKISLTKEFITK